MLITETQIVKQFSDESEFESTLSFSLEKSDVEDWVVVENDAQELSLSLANWEKLVEMGNEVISNQKQKSFENAKHFFINKIDKAIENSKQECECTDECLGYLTKTCKNISEPKQETLEEVINNEINNIHINSSNLENIAKYNRISGTLFSELKKCMINIAKWQQEQDKKLYSEVDIIEILMEYDYSVVNEGKLNSVGNINKWFEQFKNK